jgi:hypothetical protein
MTYPNTPELDKLTETFTLAQFTQRLGEALDDEKGFVLAAWVPDTCTTCGGDGKDTWEDETCTRCSGSGSDPTAITLSHRSPSNRNLATLFGLDHNKMEAERDAVLRHVQQQANRERAY